MREWLSGGAPPCKVGAAGSNSRLRAFLFSAEAFIFKGFRCFYLLPCAAVKSKTAPKIIPNPRKSGITRGVPSQKNEMITADKGSTLARMLPFKGPIMTRPEDTVQRQWLFLLQSR